jgi:hypothetical protein
VSDIARARPEPVRYAVRWRKLPELLALTASAAIWAAFLLRAS